MKNKLIKNTFYYVSIPFFKNIISFLTLPILTRYLSPDDYGKIAFLTVVTSSIGGFLFFNMVDASVRFFFDYRDDKEKLSRMFSSYLTFIFIMSCFAILIFTLGFPLMDKYIFKGQVQWYWIIIAFLYYVVSYVNVMHQYVFQNRHEGKRWMINEMIYLIVYISLTLTLVITRVWTYQALIFGMFAGEIIKSIFILKYLGVNYKFVYDKSMLNQAFKYSWPMVPVLLLDIGYRTVDKTLISIKKGMGQVGILDMSNKMTTVLKMIIDAVGGTVLPVAMDFIKEDSEDSKRKLSLLFLKVTALILLAALTVILFSEEVVHILTTPQFYKVIYVVPIYIYYHVFGIIGMISYWLIRYPGKTYWTIPSQVIFLVVNIILNIILIPKYGVFGAAIASSVAAFIFQLFQLIIGLKIFPIPLDLPKISILFLILIIQTIMFYGLLYLHLPFLLNIVVKFVFIFVFLGVVLIMNVVTKDEFLFYIQSGYNKIRSYVKI
jgi:O-antigen/teichoic acid export membrane protein